MQDILKVINKPIVAKIRRFKCLEFLGTLLIIFSFVFINITPWAIFTEIIGSIILIFHEIYKPDSLGRKVNGTIRGRN